jgi:hypothetical protein
MKKNEIATQTEVEEGIRTVLMFLAGIFLHPSCSLDFTRLGVMTHL